MFNNSGRFMRCLYCTFMGLLSFVLFVLLPMMLFSPSARFQFGIRVAAEDLTDVPLAYQNPAVSTKSLYVSGHRGQPLKEICRDDGAGLKLLVLVTSSPRHATQRNVVRSTWGTYGNRLDINLAFVVGIPESKQDNELITNENLIYGDIIQGNFMDTYNNLTLKTISMLEWTMLNCNKTKFLLKTDDDMYINFPVLLALLDRYVSKENMILGKVAKRWQPIRNKKSHYYISPDEYNGKYYPDFTTGPAYVMTNDVIARIYNASIDGVFFKLEDVYLTGVIARNISVTRVSRSEFYNNRPKKVDPCFVRKYAAIHMLKPEEVMNLWSKLFNAGESLQCP